MLYRKVSLSALCFIALMVFFHISCPSAHAFGYSDVYGDWFLTDGPFHGEGDIMSLNSDRTFQYGTQNDVAHYWMSGTYQVLSHVSQVILNVSQSTDPEVPAGTVITCQVTSISSTKMVMRVYGEMLTYVSMDERERLAADDFSDGIDWTKWILVGGTTAYYALSNNNMAISVTHDADTGYTSGNAYAENSHDFNGMSADIALNDVQGNSWGYIYSAPLIDQAGNKYVITFGLETNKWDVDGVMLANLRADVSDHDGVGRLWVHEARFNGKSVVHNVKILLDTVNDTVWFLLNDAVWASYELPSNLSYIPGVNEFTNANENWRNQWSILAGCNEKDHLPEGTIPMAKYVFDNVQFYSTQTVNETVASWTETPFPLPALQLLFD